jgi:hypothetical protein
MEIKENLMKKKILTGFLFLVIFAALAYSAYFLFGDYYWSWKIGRDYKKFEQGYLDFLKSDTYGGKTPEETYVKFVDTLRTDNIDEAVKYFYWEKQGKEKERFLKMKDEGKLEEYVSKLPEWGRMQEDDSYSTEGGKRYKWFETVKESRTVKLPLGGGKYQEEILEPGEYRQEITFWFNKQSDIWKIYSL